MPPPKIIDSALTSTPCDPNTPSMIAWGYGPPTADMGHHGMIYIDVSNTLPGRTIFVKEVGTWFRVLMAPFPV